MPASAIIDKESSNCFPEEKRSEGLELFLAECVPDVELRPLLGSFDLDDLALDLDCSGGGLILIEHVIDEAIGNGGFTNAFVTDEDQLVVKVRGVFFEVIIVEVFVFHCFNY